MKIEKDKVVIFHYALTDGEGTAIESSFEREPLAILHGHGNVIPGIETALADRVSGDRFQVTVPPEEAYGPRRDNWTQRVPKKYFRDAERLRAGEQTVLHTAEGPRMVTVAKIGQTVIDVDLNHPMAGKTLNFDIQIVDVRDASSEELAHGHVHGPGGHHH